jgi:SAM-dependent methyltransferase
MIVDDTIWDLLGSCSFNAHVHDDDIDPRFADNMIIAWPPILKLIQSTYPPNKNVRVLDYGCGTGGFCKKLHTVGYSVVGIDSSKGMIKTAKHHSASDISYFLGDYAVLPSLGKFQIIVTIMTLPFIDNLREVLRIFSNAILPGGLLIIVDFNKEWIKECLKIPVYFSDFNSIDDPTFGMMTHENCKTPVYIRDIHDYDQLMISNNIEKILHIHPPFTKEFIHKYPNYKPVHISEYLILGYKKH